MPELDEETSDLDRETAWRRQCLIELRVDAALACDYANDVDYREVARLIRQGCPPDLAVNIVR
jgi:hypothetical protein